MLIKKKCDSQRKVKAIRVNVNLKIHHELKQLQSVMILNQAILTFNPQNPQVALDPHSTEALVVDNRI